MRKPTFIDRVRYGFDNYMSRGTVALVAGLGLFTLIMVLVAGLVLAITRIHQDGGSGVSVMEGTWEALMRTLDPGTMGGDTGRWFRVVMFVVTVGGVLIVGSLIGVLTSGVEGKIEELRKGRSRVIERNHTIVLGWSRQIFSILSELVTANENQKKSCIVILGEKDKVEMEDEIRMNVGKSGRTNIVCRTGSPIDMNDIAIVNPHDSRSIIILTPENENADSTTIKAILALTNNPGRRSEAYHIVGEIRDPQNLDVARMVSHGEAQLVLAGDLIARITAQTCRQSGLSVVYTELLDFAGDEIYFQNEPALVGKTFGEALLAYEDSTLIGLRFRDGRIQLNPPMDTQIAAGDIVIAISEDDDTVRLSGLAPVPIDSAAIRDTRTDNHQPEQTLILGWNRCAPIIIHELDEYVVPGSAITVVADVGDGNEAIASCCQENYHQSVTFTPGDTTNRRVLDALDIPSYQHVIVLSYSDILEPQAADARTLVTLLHLRDIADHAPQEFAIVTEMLDVRNRELAEITRADDFIVSDKLVSLMLSQISENKELMAVFDDLFDPTGSELYLKPAGDYVALERPVNFYTVVESARRRGEVAIGYRCYAGRDKPAEAYGVVVNPDKSGQTAYTERDRIIVLAEN